MKKKKSLRDVLNFISHSSATIDFISFALESIGKIPNTAVFGISAISTAANSSLIIANIKEEAKNIED